MQSQNRNSDLGACSQVAVFVFDFILCVQRTHSTAVNEINVERPLRHIYELGAWLVTWGCRRLANAAKRNAIGSVFLLTILGIAWLIADVTNLSSPYWYY